MGTLAGGEIIDDATASGGTLPASVTFTPSIFNGQTPTVTPASLVAGAAGASALAFQTGNPLPADGKIIIEFPSTFHAVAATAATITSGMDGTLTATTSGREVTITRGGAATATAAGDDIVISIPSVTNQKYAGASGAFVSLKTTLAGGEIIDDATASGGTLPASVTFTPSIFNGQTPTVTPASLVAGAAGASALAFQTGNPLPADGKIIIEFPSTFYAVAAT